MVGFGGIPIGNDDDEVNEVEARRWRGKKGVRGATWAKFPILTIGLLGAQIVWSTEMGYASPYLLSLGLSKSAMSIVFVAGPLSGLFVQPLIGVLADNSTSKFGRRRPYMIIGSVLCAISVLVLGFTKDVASWFLPRESPGNANLTIWLAVLAIYCIDFSINAVQAADRALLVDTLPPSQQERGNAWAGRMLSIGSVVGFMVGNLPLPSIFPFLGRTQLQVLCAISAILLLLTHGMTSLMVSERILLEAEPAQHTVIPSTSGSGFRTYAPKPGHSPNILLTPFIPIINMIKFSGKMMKDIWVNVRILPPNIRQICLIQFFSWIGWFPVLFFTTVWVGEIYTLGLTDEQITQINKEGKELTEEATLVGFTALLWSSLLGLVTIIILPMVIAFFQRRQHRRQANNYNPHSYLGRFHLTLADIWTFSLTLFGFCMFATAFTTESIDASVEVIALTGLCFAVSMWVPFALLGEEISGASNREPNHSYQALPVEVHDEEEETEEIPLHPQNGRRGGEAEPLSTGVVFEADPEARRDVDENTLVDHSEHPRDLGDRDEYQPARRNDTERSGNNREEESALMKDLERSELGVDPNGAGSSRQGEDIEMGRAGKRKITNIADKAGIILGIHNVAVVIPQFLVTGLSSIIFAFFDNGVTGIHPGAGHAGAGVGPGGAAGAVADAETSTISDPDPDIGFDEKGGDGFEGGEFARRAGKVVGRAVGRTLRRTVDAALQKKDELAGGGNPDGIGLIFKVGGVSSLIAAALCWKLARDLRRGYP